MSLAERIEALKAKHQVLEEALDEQHSRPKPDEDEVLTLKKQKLRIKDELLSLIG